MANWDIGDKKIAGNYSSLVEISLYSCDNPLFFWLLPLPI